MSKKILFILAIAACLISCKEDNWMDWKAQNEMWMEQNLLDPEVQMTADSLQYKIISPGNTTDARPQAGSTVICDYRGTLINGYQFDANTNASFSMSGVVKGFAEGLTKIHNHGDIIIYVPWHLAYGEEGSGNEGNSYFIPPYSTLIFTVHLSSVN